MSALLSCWWGFCEATFFFIVPDVWLTWLAWSGRDKREVWTAWACAIAGALAGGLVCYVVGRLGPYDVLVAWLDRIPGISHRLVQEVSGQVVQGGAGSIFAGILRGIPYKIYAVQWGAQGGSVLIWLAVSFLARGGRFAFSIILTRAIDRIGGRCLRGWAGIKTVVFLLFWGSFYCFYFWYYGG